VYLTWSKKLTCIASLIHHTGQTEELKKKPTKNKSRNIISPVRPVIMKAVQGRRRGSGHFPLDISPGHAPLDTFPPRIGYLSESYFTSFRFTGRQKESP